MSDIIWALDQRERCIACPSKPAANAVVLYLGEDGSLPRESVGSLAERGVMAAGVVWAGVTAELTDDDWLDLEDAASGLGGLASAVAVVGEGDAAAVAQKVAERVGGLAHAGAASDERLVEKLAAIAPV